MVDKTLIDHAIEWAESGVPVFPCNGKKKPLTEHGFYDAESDPVKVRALFEFYGQDAQMIGGRMGDGVFAVDVDLYKGKEPKEWLDKMTETGMMPDTRIHETKNGGLHFLYEGDTPSTVPAPGVEVKGEGSYVVLPGTPGYKVVKGGMSKATPELLAVIGKSISKTKGHTVNELEANILSGADFHNSLAQLGAKLAMKGWNQVEIQSRLLELLDNSTAKNPGHERHARWRNVVADSGGELSRIASSADAKYNDQSVMDGMAEFSQLGEIQEQVKDVFEHTVDNFEPEQEIKYDEDKWPFEGYGYFADEEHDLADQDFTMYPIYAEGETVVIFAEPKTGKTAIALTTALHIACGFDLGHLKVTGGGPCLYYALEGSRAVRLRVESWKKIMRERDVELPDRIPLFVVEKPANFLKEDARAAAANQIIAADKYGKKLGQPLKCIYIDTLTKAMAGGDQNSVEDTSSMFEVVGLCRAGGVTATIVFVHHKARTGNLRGSSNIEAEPDVLLDVSKKGEVVSMKIARARSIEDGSSFHFALSDVDLGINKQGHKIHGLFVEPMGDMDETKDMDIAEVQQLVQRRDALIRVMHDGRASATDVVYEWFKHKLIKGRNLRGNQVPPSVTNPATQKALHDLAPDAGGTVYGERLIRVQKEGRDVVEYHILELKDVD